jgi:hypothetical protein
MASQACMQSLQRVTQLVRFQRLLILIKALLANAFSKIASSAVHRHVPAAILAVSQCNFNLLFEIYQLRERESTQISFHWTTCKFGGFQQVHTGGGDDKLHVSQSFLANFDLILHC